MDDYLTWSEMSTTLLEKTILLALKQHQYIKEAKHIAQQVRLQIKVLKIAHINSSLDLYVTLSFWVSCCIPNSNLSFDVLVAAADRGLYQAKEMGRNRVVEYEIKPE